MATMASILIPGGPNGVSATLNTVTASSAITLGPQSLFVIGSDQAITITFGNEANSKSATTPSATVGFRIPAGALVTFDLGEAYDSFKIFNTAGFTANYTYQVLSKF